MKSNMRIVILIIILISFISCDNRKDFFKELNRVPVVTVSGKLNSWATDTSYNKEIYDTFKLGVNDRYKISLRINDDNIMNEIGVHIFNGTESLYDNTFYKRTGKQVEKKINEETIIDVTEKEVEIEFYTDLLWDHILNFKIYDSYNEEDFAKIHLNVFNNWPPVTGLTYQVIGVLSPYEVKIDASGSYDQDKKFGGKILEYEYVIDDTYIVNTDKNFIKYIFPSNGNYIIKLKVMDNDSAWTNYETITLSL